MHDELGGPDPAEDVPINRIERRWALAAIALIAAALGGAIRWWVRTGVVPRRWRDSEEYVVVSRAGWFASQRWIGSRPVLFPSLLTVVSQRLGALVTAQVLIGAVSWAVLAMSMAACLRPGWRRWVMAGMVVALSVTGPVAMWDAQVLTESLAWSVLVVVTAAMLWAARSFGLRSVLAVVGACALLLAVRDSNVVPVLVGAIAWAAWALVRRSPTRRAVLAAAAVLSMLSVAVVVTANKAGRQGQPTEHLFAARVIPYPDRLAWFEAHGMPQVEQLRHLPSKGVNGQARWTPIPHGGEFWPWRRWVRDDGRTAFARYVLTHPTYLVTEPIQRPEHTFDSGRGIARYRPRGLRSVPLVTGLFWPSVAVTLLVAAGATAVIWRRKVGRSPLVIAGLVLVGTAGPHAFVVWHSDGMESARHLLVPNAQLHLGTLLLLAAALLVDTRTGSTDPQELAT
jgi:hypothetical protein